MPKIKILPQHVSDMIAAGEVVERPASVVKELVENALDAEARRIVVEVDDGGKNLIRVTDDGVGMDKEDAQLAFVRHATSKIAAASDLNAIHTLGFRGEALASIASVSYVELKTRAAGSIEGTHVLFKTGRIEFTRTTSFPMGTCIEIKHLFINMPARKKFLKAETTEFAHISKTMTYQALSHFEVAFRLIHNGKEVFDFPKGKDSNERTALVLGKETFSDLLPIYYGGEALHIDGFIGTPEIARRNRQNQYIILNGREILDAALAKAVYEGYHSLLPNGKFPMFVLKIAIEPQFVDVNVHPRKLEVKFVNPHQVFDAVQMSVKAALQKYNLAPTLAAQQLNRSFRVFDSSPQTSSTPASGFQSLSLYEKENSPQQLHAESSFTQPSGFEKKPIYSSLSSSPSQEHVKFSQMSSAEKRAFFLERKARQLGISSSSSIQSALNFTEQIVNPETKSESLQEIWKPLAQFNNSYIVAEDSKGILIFDQHAAHERVQYMKLVEGLGKGQIVQQQLLMPFQLELSYREASVFEPAIDCLKQIGFEVEVFGQRTFLVRAVPLCLTKDNLEEVIRGVIDDLLEDKEVREVMRREEKVIISVACKSAIKFGRCLTMLEMEELLKQLNSLSQKYTCPHGRPTMIILTYEELERKFGRK